MTDTLTRAAFSEEQTRPGGTDVVIAAGAKPLND